MSFTDPEQPRNSSFSQLARAVLDSLAEAVIVFDSGGEVTYANDKAVVFVESIGVDLEAGAETLMPQLARRGGRIAPLRFGAETLGEAVYVPVEAGGKSLADRERLAIVDTLDRTDWKLAESAKLLGISRTTLWRRLKTYGIHRQRSGWAGNGQ